MIILVNPKSAKWKHRLPMSIMSLAAVLEDRYPYELIDGNFEPDLEAKLVRTIRETNAKYLGITVMPGPQLLQAICSNSALVTFRRVLILLQRVYRPARRPRLPASARVR